MVKSYLEKVQAASSSEDYIKKVQKECLKLEDTLLDLCNKVTALKDYEPVPKSCEDYQDYPGYIILSESYVKDALKASDVGLKVLKDIKTNRGY